MECPHVPEITAGEFAEALGEHLGPHGRIPLNGTIELTARCNLNCAHCYINLPADDREAQAQELTTQEICSLLDTLADEGTLFLLLTGGEIFVRKDFMEIYIYAKRKGMLINLFTNGTLITERIADHLQDWPPRMVEITFYGATAETYERVTGVPGSYERCMRGIDLLLDRGIPLALKTMVLTLNRHELEAIQALARDFGVGFRYDAQIWPRLDGRRSPCSLRLSPEEVVRLDIEDAERAAGWEDLLARHPEPFASEYLYNCAAGIWSCWINAAGHLSFCGMMPHPTYDLRQGTFHEAFYEFIPQLRLQKPERPSKCQTCQMAYLCGRCPAFAQVETGDLAAPVPYLCQVGRLRAQTFRQDLP